MIYGKALSISTWCNLLWLYDLMPHKYFVSDYASFYPRPLCIMLIDIHYPHTQRITLSPPTDITHIITD